MKVFCCSSASAGEWSVCLSLWVCVCVSHCECVSLVRTRSCSGMARFVSLCQRGVRTWGGGVRTLWATPGAFSRDHNSSPRVTMATRSSSSAHQATEPFLAAVLSLEKKRDTLPRDRNNPSRYSILKGTLIKHTRTKKKLFTLESSHVIATPV